MKQNAVGWFDIYVNDMDRAVNFYQTVFNQELEDLGDPTDSSVIMKAFPTEMANYGAGGALVKREGAGPVTGGTIVYFGTEDCSAEESRVSDAGGQVINPKMSIASLAGSACAWIPKGIYLGLAQ